MCCPSMQGNCAEGAGLAVSSLHESRWPISSSGWFPRQEPVGLCCPVARQERYRDCPRAAPAAWVWAFARAAFYLGLSGRPARWWTAAPMEAVRLAGAELAAERALPFQDRAARRLLSLPSHGFLQ